MAHTVRWLLFVLVTQCFLTAHAQTMVLSVAPADGASGVPVAASIVVTFSDAMDASTLTTQTAAGPCAGTLQVSSNGFADCIGFSSAAAATVGSVATITPVPALAFSRIYRVRVSTGAKSVAQVSLPAAFSQAIGFTTVAGGIAFVGVQSRKFHAAAGPFDIAVDRFQPIGGAVTVEPRDIGTGHTIVFQFDGPVTAAGNATAVDELGAPIGIANAMASGNDVVVALTNVPDKQRVAIALANINNVGLSAAASMGFFVGGVSGLPKVSAADIGRVKSRSGQAVTAANFRYDLNASGVVNANDIVTVKRRANLPLPATFTVGGTITGLVGTLVLQNNGQDNLTRTTNGVFTFALPLATAAGYAVTVLTAPSGQTCVASNSFGTIGTTNVTNITIVCAATTYTLSGSVSGTVLQNVIVALNGDGSMTTVTAANGSYSFSGLLPGNYLVTPMLTGYAFNPYSRPVTITGTNSAANNFVSAVTVNPRPVVGTFLDTSTVNLPPASRDLFDGTKILLKRTIFLPDNCPQSFVIANVGTVQSTLDYVVADDGGLGGFLDFTNGAGSMQNGNSNTVSVTVDPRFVASEPTLVGATLGLSIYTPQATNVIKSFVSFDIRSTNDALIGTWSGTWSGLGYGRNAGGGPDPTVAISGNWVMQVNSVDFTTGSLGGTLNWTGSDAVWSSDGQTPTLVSINHTTIFTPVNTSVQITGNGTPCPGPRVTINFNKNFASAPSGGPNGFIYLNLALKAEEGGSHFFTNPVWPSGGTGLSGGSLSGTKNP